ncbi:protein of unknown function DUF1471 [Dickeya chrysanthemi Ech1591]|uniref:YdgH/BhsA/McbA-like domain-containing protein n=1 Tax=Dickeya chrysanthemi (strain Ech1591) TaxID=561229 RepID=C6CQ29_DICC1|nr:MULTISPECIES: YdgH/BhsA/McbA-like domain containing protein [Dickeya]ACT08906.1 protein of unknown function DUF1471 [Dickeya chrysanthemi Ech1591]TYL41105.1 DUF1471 domain-containing protein [Dickeya sp. ws52]WJM86946.1 DUF1471 domain-containing protein [Dickeya chrysanthemi]
MKNIKTIAIAAALATVSFGSFAAQSVSYDQAQQLEKIGSVSATANDLSSLQAKLADKASEAGASAYTITYASGDDTLHGNATIYK